MKPSDDDRGERPAEPSSETPPPDAQAKGAAGETAQAPAIQESSEVGLAAVPPSASEEIEALRRETGTLKEQLLRRRAEFENYRKRTERERQSWALDAEAALVKELVPVIDHLEQALKSDTSGSPLRQGVELILRDLLGSLGKLGLEVHDPVGRPFDPLLDQALAREQADGLDEGTVIETYRSGYLYKGRLLRPALVKVAQVGSQGNGSSSQDGPSAPGQDEVH